MSLTPLPTYVHPFFKDIAALDLRAADSEVWQTFFRLAMQHRIWKPELRNGEPTGRFYGQVTIHGINLGAAVQRQYDAVKAAKRLGITLGEYRLQEYARDRLGFEDERRWRDGIVVEK